VKEADGEWVMGGTGKGQEDSLVTTWLEQNYDLDIKYIPYSGGGAVAKDLAGQQIMSSVNNPSEAKGFFENGDVVKLLPIIRICSKLFMTVKNGRDTWPPKVCRHCGWTPTSNLRTGILR